MRLTEARHRVGGQWRTRMVRVEQLRRRTLERACLQQPRGRPFYQMRRLGNHHLDQRCHAQGILTIESPVHAYQGDDSRSETGDNQHALQQGRLTKNVDAAPAPAAQVRGADQPSRKTGRVGRARW